MSAQADRDPAPRAGDEEPLSASRDNRRAGADRRAEPRVPADRIPHISARLSTPGQARLVNLSATGARFQCERRFLPNAAVFLRLVTPDSTLTVSGRIVRSRMVRLESGGFGYDVAISFTSSVGQLLGDAAEGEGPGPVAHAEGEATSLADPTIVTATVPQSSDALRELFDGNQW